MADRVISNRIMYRKKVSSLMVTCVRGAAWITWKGSEDYVLEPGQSMEIRDVREFCLEILRGGDALLAERAPGDEPGSLTVEAPPARSSSAA